MRNTPNLVYLLKLRTGEEIMARIVDEDDTTITIENGLSLVPYNAGHEGVQIQLVPVLFSAPMQEQVQIYKDALLMVPIEAPSNLQDEFVKQTSNLTVVSGVSADQILKG